MMTKIQTYCTISKMLKLQTELHVKVNHSLIWNHKMMLDLQFFRLYFFNISLHYVIQLYVNVYFWKENNSRFFLIQTWWSLKALTTSLGVCYVWLQHMFLGWFGHWNNFLIQGGWFSNFMWDLVHLVFSTFGVMAQKILTNLTLDTSHHKFFCS